MPIKCVIGAILAKKVPAKETFKSAKPAKIPANNTRIIRSILIFPPFTTVYVQSEKEVQSKRFIYKKWVNIIIRYLILINGLLCCSGNNLYLLAILNNSLFGGLILSMQLHR